MVDRRNLTIPINLGFLAVLVALSAFVNDAPTALVAEKQAPASPVDTMPPHPRSLSKPVRLPASHLPGRRYG